jgi:putative membrane protein
MKTKRWLVNALKGAALGLGMIPGVSAGMVALAVGIYDTLIGAIANLRKNFKENMGILLPYFIGAVLSAVVVMVGVSYGYRYAHLTINCLFAGFIIGTIPLVTKNLKKSEISAKTILLVVGGFIFTAGIGVLSLLSKLYWGFDIESYFESNAWWIYPAVFVAGFLAAAACILPGLSGALILYILGFYDPIVALYIGSNSMLHNHDRVVSGLLLSLILIFGIVLGFVAASKFMKSLLARHHSETMFVVLGFLLGSFVSTFVNQSVFSNGNWMYLTARPWEWVVGPLLLIAVSVGFFFLSKISSKKKITNIQQ